MQLTEKHRDSTIDSHIRNRSSDRISNHSIESKHQHTILSRVSIEKLPKRQHQKSLTISTNGLAEKRNTIETPAFSQRGERAEKEDQKEYQGEHDIQGLTNKEVYELLESIKIMPMRMAKKEELVRGIREGLRKMKDEVTLHPQIQTIERVLQTIQSKLKHPYPTPTSPSSSSHPPPPLPQPLSTPTPTPPPLFALSQISPIRRLSPPKVLYSNLNLQLLCDQSTSKVNYEEVSNVDNIEYCKIMHMLGEKYEITPKKDKRNSTAKKQEELAESVKISQLNLELEMLENLLQSKKKNIQKGGGNGSGSKGIRGILEKRKTAGSSLTKSSISTSSILKDTTNSSTSRLFKRLGKY